MKLAKRSTFNVIFLAPIVAVAMSDNGGCSASRDAGPGPLTAEEIKATLAGNTVKTADEEIYALVSADGTLKGLNIPSGATEGSWRVSDNAVLCATWNAPGGPQENCSTFQFVSPEIGYNWGGSSLLVLEGNPQGL